MPSAATSWTPWHRWPWSAGTWPGRPRRRGCAASSRRAATCCSGSAHREAQPPRWHPGVAVDGLEAHRRPPALLGADHELGAVRRRHVGGALDDLAARIAVDHRLVALDVAGPAVPPGD